jgi:hypothetical protein
MPVRWLWAESLEAGLLARALALSEGATPAPPNASGNDLFFRRLWTLLAIRVLQHLELGFVVASRPTRRP